MDYKGQYYDEALLHYGVLGMKWGRRKSRSQRLQGKLDKQKKRLKELSDKQNDTIKRVMGNVDLYSDGYVRARNRTGREALIESHRNSKKIDRTLNKHNRIEAKLNKSKARDAKKIEKIKQKIKDLNTSGRLNRKFDKASKLEKIAKSENKGYVKELLRSYLNGYTKPIASSKASFKTTLKMLRERRLIPNKHDIKYMNSMADMSKAHSLRNKASKMKAKKLEKLNKKLKRYK